MANKQRSTVVGVFEDRLQADRAITELKRAGFGDGQIGVASRHTDDLAAGTSSTGSEWETGAVTGALTGAGLGGLVGLGIIAGVIPVLGPVLAGGTLAAILANAAGGAALGSLVGALIGSGIPEEEANYYQSEFESGRTIVTVKADGRAAEASEILRRFGAYDMSTRGASTATSTSTSTSASTGRAATATSGSTATGRTGAGKEKIQVREEEVTARKTPVETGEVRVRKEVVTEHKTLEVPVSREEVVIERHPVSGRQATSGSEIRAGEEIRIPVREEQVSVEKHAVVKEEISVGKRTVQDTEHVAADVKKEKVKVERTGDVDIRGGGTGGTSSH